MSSRLWAPSESSASEPESAPAPSLASVRAVLAAVEASAARCLRADDASILPSCIITGMARANWRAYAPPAASRQTPGMENHALLAHHDPRDRSRQDARLFRREARLRRNAATGQ